MSQHASEPNLEVEIAALLSDLTAVQEELLDVLVLKRDSMASSDAGSMTQLQAREEDLGQRLRACHHRRGELLEAAADEGLPSGSIGELSAVFATENREKLRKQIRESSARMRLLQHQSLTNWVVAQRTLLHLSQMLEIIATGGRIQPTYGKGEPAGSRGALVDREA